MNNNASATTQCDMELIAHQAIIAVFTHLMRIRVATQHGHQRLMTLSILRAAFDEALRGHESQALVNGLLDQRGIFFRDSFCRLQLELLREVDTGLTDSEKAELGI